MKESAKTIEIEINHLNPAEYNPRQDLTPADPEYQKILKSIKKFGYVQYIVVNRDLTVIGGHQRLKVLKDLGYKTIEVLQVDLNKSDEKALNLTLNKVEGYWDRDLLSNLLKDLDSVGYELDVTGFSEIEIEGLLGEVSIPDDIFTPSSDKDSNSDRKDDDFVEFEEEQKEITCPRCGGTFTI